jgi:hypothetical protein
MPERHEPLLFWLEDYQERPYRFPAGPGTVLFLFFSTRDRALEVLDSFVKPQLGNPHPILGARLPTTLDNWQVGKPSDVDELRAFCERAYWERGFTGFLVDPTDEELGTPKLAHTLDLDQVKELIAHKAG